MRWYHVFIKGVKEQVRDYWILVMIIVMAPLFIAIYFLMEEGETTTYDVVFVNLDKGGFVNPDTGGQAAGRPLNLGDSLVHYIGLVGQAEAFRYSQAKDRASAVGLLKADKADVVVVLPEDLTVSLLAACTQQIIALWSPDHGAVSLDPGAGGSLSPARLELVGDLTKMEYIIGAIWTEELINGFVMQAAGIQMPVTWTETPLGYSGNRSYFELYVPGLLILSIIMIIFSASAAIVREPETRTLERLKVSRLTSLEFLAGTSLVQIIIAMLSLALALLTAIALGYTLIPGTLGFLLLISFLTALSMISFSLLVAAMCRSIKEVAIIGTFPLFLLMFFTGAAFPIGGGELFTIAGYTFRMNDILSPTWAVDALNKVLVMGLEPRETVSDMIALLILTVLYFFLGTRAFRARHMRAL